MKGEGRVEFIIYKNIVKKILCYIYLKKNDITIT